jgi:hypothetical protein
VVTEGVRPLLEYMCCRTTAAARALLRPSATSRKRSGDKGKPCLSPLLDLKKGEASLLMSTVKETEEMQAIIHFINGS